MFRKKVWVFVGTFCASHLAKVCETYGTVRVQTLDPEMVKLDRRCEAHDCNGHVEFLVEKVE